MNITRKKLITNSKIIFIHRELELVHLFDLGI